MLLNIETNDIEHVIIYRKKKEEREELDKKTRNTTLINYLKIFIIIEKLYMYFKNIYIHPTWGKTLKIKM